MSTALQKCPFCDETFRGDPSPRTADENAYVLVGHHVLVAHLDKVMRCPRRNEILIGRDAAPVDFWRADDTCSYCGSMSATAFFAAIETGLSIGPTDKSYKVYVGDGERRKFNFQHLSSDQQDQQDRGAARIADTQGTVGEVEIQGNTAGMPAPQAL